MWVPLYFSCAKGPRFWHFRRLNVKFWFNCVSWHTGHWQSMLKQSPNHKLKSVDIVHFYQSDKMENMCRQDQREKDAIIAQASVFVLRLTVTSSCLHLFPCLSNQTSHKPKVFGEPGLVVNVHLFIELLWYLNSQWFKFPSEGSQIVGIRIWNDYKVKRTECKNVYNIPELCGDSHPPVLTGEMFAEIYI